MTAPRRISATLAWCAVAAAIVGSMWVLRSVRDAGIRAVTYALPGGTETGVMLPAYVEGELTHVDFRVVFRADPSLGGDYVLARYGCIESLKLDGAPLRVDGAIRCDNNAGTHVDFATPLRDGDHTLAITLAPNDYAPQFVAVESLRPTVGSARAAASLGLAVLLVLGMWLVATGLTFGWRGPMAWLSYACGLGAAVRLAWTAVASLGAHTPDAVGHLEYVQRMLHNPGIPPPSAGWEAFQPPLYYWLAAGWVRLLSFAHAGVPWLDDAQILSLLLSIISLCLAAACVNMLCGRQPFRHRDAAGCTLALAVFPGLVMYAPRVTNDVLLQCLAFAFLALLLRWMRSDGDDRAAWMAACFAVCAGVVTKSNALVWVAIAGAALWVRGVRPRTAAARFGLLLGSLAVLCGWLFVLRFAIQGQNGLIANIGQLPDADRVPNTLTALARFSPFSLVLHPYTNVDQSFPEYFFSSLFFGAYQYPIVLVHLARYAMLGACICAAFAAYGMIRTPYGRTHAGALAALALFLLSQYAYRITYPFTYDQDARFSAVLSLFLLYGALRGVRLLPDRWRALGESALIAACLSWAAFVVGVIAVS